MSEPCEHERDRAGDGHTLTDANRITIEPGWEGPIITEEMSGYDNRRVLGPNESLTISRLEGGGFYISYSRPVE